MTALVLRGRSGGESREAGGVKYDWVTIVAIPLVCFSPFWVCMWVSKLSYTTWINPFFASKPVRRELSVLLTADKVLNLRNSWHVWRSPYIHAGVQL